MHEDYILPETNEAYIIPATSRLIGCKITVIISALVLEIGGLLPDLGKSAWRVPEFMKGVSLVTSWRECIALNAVERPQTFAECALDLV